MRHSILIAALLIIAIGCKTEKNYIASNSGPADWQGPVIEWRTAIEAEVRGTVGLDVNVTDSSAVVRVSFYLDGQTRQTLTAPPWRFEIATDSLLDGVHWCEARAFDQFGNLGISPTLRMNVMNSMAEGPRLLWVPDSFATIQAAINAATDFDTIRVRDGIYYETLNLFGKGIWLESEHGPLRCTVDGIASNSAITISPSDLVSTVRGFWLTGAVRLVRFELGGQCNFYCNIFFDDSSSALFYSSYSGGKIHNNLFSGGDNMVQIGYHWGEFYNNILQHAHEAALWNAAVSTNPLLYGYNLFWDNGRDYDHFLPTVTDVFSDPLLNMTQGGLGENSPAIDHGEPDILDRNGSRSDIGPFGGQYAY